MTGTIYINWHGPHPHGNTWGASWQFDDTDETQEIDNVSREEAVAWAKTKSARSILLSDPEQGGEWVKVD